MEPSSLLSGSDNLFKYLFTVGALMVVVSIVYPLQKKQEIEIQINYLLKESELLNYQVNNLKEDYQKSLKEHKEILGELEYLKSTLGKNVKDNERFIKQRSKGNELIQKLKARERELAVKNIVFKNEQAKVDLLKGHADSYNGYYLFVKRVGVFFFFLGFMGWSLSTFFQDQANWLNFFKKVFSRKEVKPLEEEKSKKDSDKEHGVKGS